MTLGKLGENIGGLIGEIHSILEHLFEYSSTSFASGKSILFSILFRITVSS